MVQIGSQAADQLKRDPTPTSYTFTDEMWRTQTVHPHRLFSQESDDGRRVPENNPRYLARRRPPRTMAQRAYLEDLKLWLSSSSVEEYEERESSRDEERRLEREAFMQAQPLFHKFPLLPPVLRLHVWKLALEEPTRVTLTISRLEPYTRCGRGIRDDGNSASSNARQ